MKRIFALALLATPLATGESPFVVGVCTHFSQGKGDLAANVSLIRQAGVDAIRDDLSWGAIERDKGQYSMPAAYDAFVDRAVAAGLQPLLIFAYGNRFYDNHDKPTSDEAIEAYTRYAEFAVRHFKGKVRMYEVWNEWDIKIGGTSPGSAEDYAKLLKVVYPRIKKIDPEITVLGGCPTSGGIKKGWLDRFLASDVLHSLDAVSIHTYNYGEHDRGRTPEAWADFVAAAETSIHQHSGGRDVPLYVTEMGWPTHVGPRGTSTDQSAAYLARTYLLARTMPYLKGFWWYDFQDDGWKSDYNEHNFGTVRPDLTPKPSYYALASISKLVSEGEFVSRLDTPWPDLWALKFRANGGKTTVALWSEGEPRQLKIAAEGPVRIIEAGRQPVEHAASGSIGIEAGEDPILVEGERLALLPQ